ncbi:hypothetical protein [Parahaliea mediterranea]|uniref:Uncharacterized protein n=1 Tax=Parahaliea mediterranea TaxID=651086 RepID=A0A939IMI7_9GAMM|nr:hypothetical protein [Parahaliea mediterranea]MBN7797565.1 hypothetical protein [Parahaliea mediterranea]
MQGSSQAHATRAEFSQQDLMRAAVRRYLARDPDFINLDCLRWRNFNQRQLDSLARQLEPRTRR